jgi:hypothetical protein
LDYATYFGMMLNGDRVRYRGVYFQTLAATLANSQEHMPDAVVRAACATEQEFRRLKQEIDTARDLAKKGWG